MRTSEYILATLKETPSDAEIVSHQLMLRAGMIRKLASGLYTWLPSGLKVFRKVERIVREEMDKAGAIELSMPVIQPAELWQESGRWEQFGPELMRINDRHGRPFALGPTHEEVITDQLHGFADPTGQHRPTFPIIFSHTVFDRYDRILFDPAFQIIDKLAGI